jgi:hypothetical protein
MDRAGIAGHCIMLRSFQEERQEPWQTSIWVPLEKLNTDREDAFCVDQFGFIIINFIRSLLASIISQASAWFNYSEVGSCPTINNVPSSSPTSLNHSFPYNFFTKDLFLQLIYINPPHLNLYLSCRPPFPSSWRILIAEFRAWDM